MNPVSALNLYPTEQSLKRLTIDVTLDSKDVGGRKDHSKNIENRKL